MKGYVLGLMFSMAIISIIGCNHQQGKENGDPPIEKSIRCTSDADCGQGFSCWHQIPRGALAGIRGSEENPGWCWRDDVIQQTF